MLITKFVPATSQLPDIFTKALPKMHFKAIKIKLGVPDHSLLCLKGSNRDKKMEEKMNRLEVEDIT